MPFAPMHYPLGQGPAEDGSAVDIAEGVLWMRLPMPHLPDHINIYAFDEGDGWTVVDTGYDLPETRALWDKILTGPLAGKPVARLLCTHHHPDHIGLAGWFQEELGATLMMSRLAWHIGRMRVLDVQPKATAADIAFWRAAGMRPEMLEKRIAARPMNYSDTVVPMPMGYFRLREGAVLRMGGRDWDIRRADGHAAGQVTLWSRDDALVIGADHLLPGASASIGVYSTEPEADPVSEWLETCARLAAVAREDHIVLPGHGPVFTGLPGRLDRMVRNRQGKLSRLLSHLDQPQTACDSFSALFKRVMDGPLYGHALVESVAHLNHLYQTGKVSRTARGDGAWLWQAKERDDG